MIARPSSARPIESSSIIGGCSLTKPTRHSCAQLLIEQAEEEWATHQGGQHSNG